MKSLINLGISFALLTSAILFVQKKRLDSPEVPSSQVESASPKALRSTPVLQIRVPETHSQKTGGQSKAQATPRQGSCPKNSYYEIRQERVSLNWTYCRNMKDHHYGEVDGERFLIVIERLSDPALNADYKLEGVTHTFHVTFSKIRDKNLNDSSLLFSETIESPNDYLYPYQLMELSKSLPNDINLENYNQIGYANDTLCRNIETQEYERLITNNLNPEVSQTLKARSMFKLKSHTGAIRVGCKSQEECQCQTKSAAPASFR